MKGGDFIGKGTYGCVFKPAVPCNDKSTYPKKVGKVFFDNDGFKDEKKIAVMLEKIDPEQKCLLYPVDNNCIVKKDKVLDEDRMDECEISNYYGDRFSQMLMEYGGLSMTDYLESLKTKMSRRDAARMLSNVFEGVDLLVKNRLVHQDIKPDNVVVDSTGKSKLIDFGLLTTFGKFQNNFLFHHEYFVNGPEYRLALYNRDFMNTLWHLKNNLVRRCFLDDWKSSGLDIIDSHYVESLKDYLRSKSKHLPEKADIYPLGVLMASVYPYLISASKDDPKHVKMYNDLLYRLLRPDPKDRPSVAEAASMLRRLVSSPMVSPPVVKNRAPVAKDCPPGKVLNPATGRCVKADGKLGRALAEAKGSAPKATKKECPPGKLLNPVTGRCVRADGKIGRSLALK